MKKLFEKTKLKKVLSVALAAAMILSSQLLAPISAKAGSAEQLPNGYITDEHGLIAYNPNGYDGIDVIGYVDGQWRYSTFAGNGFMADVYGAPRGDIEVSVKNIQFIADGEAVEVVYEVKALQDVNAYRFFLAADTMVNRNDASSNTVSGDNVVIMTDDRSGISFFAFSSTEGGVPVPTELYVRGVSGVVSYGQVVIDGYDPSLTTPFTSVSDSAFVLYFPETSLAAGESAEYTFISGMGDAESIGSIIAAAKNASNASVPTSDYTPDTETSAPIPTHYNDQIVDISSAIKNNTYNAVLDSSNLKDAIARNSEEARLGIWTWAEVTDENIPEEDINIINKNVKGATVGACLDIDLYKQIGGWERTPIYETLAPVSITVDIPAAIYDANREYAVVRVHNGVYEQITSFAKSADARITISSNLFSTYAIIYKDASAVKSPKTGENMTWFYMTIVAGACVAGLGIYRRKEN